MPEDVKQESEKSLALMANEEFKTDLGSYLKTRYPLFYVTTNEEKRFLQFMRHYCRAFGYECYIWDCYHGLVNLESGEKEGGSEDSMKEPPAVLEYIIGEATPFSNNAEAIKSKIDNCIRGIIYILLDYFRFLGEESRPDIERRLKAITNVDSIVSTIITGPVYETAPCLENLMPVVDFPYPNREEIKQALEQVVDGVAGKIEGINKSTKSREEELINSVSGLTLIEAQSAFSKSLVAHKKWSIRTILREKKQIISKNGILDYYDNNVSLKDVGGLKNLVNWIKKRKTSFSKEAETYGISKPKGLLTIGFPGCGKSLTCKAIADAWSMPLLRLDFGKLFDSLVGQSEARARSAIKLAETVAPCCLWIDEIEKGLSGVSSSGRTDGGTTSRVLSTFLTWMQEKTSPVFVIATANDHEAIPSEFLRAGRFDEIFFVDLPSLTERKEIFSVLLKKKGFDPKKFSLDTLAAKSDKYSGAEIEKAIDGAMLVGFEAKQRKITNNDIVKEFKRFKPLSVMRKEDFEALKEFADERCVKANTEDKNTTNLGLDGGKSLDIE